jgi:hypothetical protein
MIETLRILGASRVVCNAYNLDAGTVLSDENLDLVTSDITIRPASYFNCKRVLLRINSQSFAQSHVEVNVDPLTGDTIFLMIDTAEEKAIEGNVSDVRSFLSQCRNLGQ